MLKAILTLLLILNTSSQSFLIEKSDHRQLPQIKYSSREINVVVTAKSGLAYDIDSQTVLWSKEIDRQLPIASLTKLISGIILLNEQLDYNQLVTITKADQRAEGGNRQLYLGEQVRVEDLFYSAFVASDNEAVIALIRTAGYSEEEFVKKMNTWLYDNGFFYTQVNDASGLNSANISTANDIAQIALYAFTKTDLPEFLQKENYQFIISNTGRQVNLKNTNELLASEFGIKFGKTGYTEEAGYCLVTLVEIQGSEVITVVLGSETISGRFQDTKSLVYWLNNNFIW